MSDDLPAPDSPLMPDFFDCAIRTASITNDPDGDPDHPYLVAIRDAGGVLRWFRTTRESLDNDGRFLCRGTPPETDGTIRVRPGDDGDEGLHVDQYNVRWMRWPDGAPCPKGRVYSVQP